MQSGRMPPLPEQAGPRSADAVARGMANADLWHSVVSLQLVGNASQRSVRLHEMSRKAARRLCGDLRAGLVVDGLRCASCSGRCALTALRAEFVDHLPPGAPAGVEPRRRSAAQPVLERNGRDTRWSMPCTRMLLVDAGCTTRHMDRDVVSADPRAASRNSLDRDADRRATAPQRHRNDGRKPLSKSAPPARKESRASPSAVMNLVDRGAPSTLLLHRDSPGHPGPGAGRHCGGGAIAGAFRQPGPATADGGQAQARRVPHTGCAPPPRTTVDQIEHTADRSRPHRYRSQRPDRRATNQRVALANTGPARDPDARLAELDREWDMNASWRPARRLMLVRHPARDFRDRRWFLLPGPSPVPAAARRCRAGAACHRCCAGSGITHRRRDQPGRFALKALRGDFRDQAPAASAPRRTVLQAIAPRRPAAAAPRYPVNAPAPGGPCTGVAAADARPRRRRQLQVSIRRSGRLRGSCRRVDAGELAQRAGAGAAIVAFGSRRSPFRERRIDMDLDPARRRRRRARRRDRTAAADEGRDHDPDPVGPGARHLDRAPQVLAPLTPGEENRVAVGEAWQSAVAIEQVTWWPRSNSARSSAAAIVICPSRTGR